jgi:hypothetical protein
MNEMIKRVAKAIEDYHDKDAWSPYERIGHVVALECARAAIAAMREPTEAMCDAANEAVFQGGQPPSQPDIVWPAMIDASLKDEPL